MSLVITKHIQEMLREATDRARRAELPDESITTDERLLLLTHAASQARHASAELEAEVYKLRDGVHLA